jgi:chromosome segregation ATPase
VFVTVQEVHRALAAAKSQLSSLGGVNRQALDQYTAFQQQQTELAARKVGGWV